MDKCRKGFGGMDAHKESLDFTFTEQGGGARRPGQIGGGCGSVVLGRSQSGSARPDAHPLVCAPWPRPGGYTAPIARGRSPP